MKTTKFYIIAGLIALLFIIGGILLVTQNTTDSPQAAINNTSSNNAKEVIETDKELLSYLDTEAQQYKDMKQYLTAEQFDEFFIANMIHFSEGLEQLEALAAKSSNTILSAGALERSANASKDVVFYKQLQKDKELPVSYGDNMQYHGAMGADSAVYLAISSLEGLSGQEYEDELVGQLEEFRMNITMIAAIGLDVAQDMDVQKLVKEELRDNKLGLDVLKEATNER